MSTAPDDAREREALAREISETRKVRMDVARQAARLLLGPMKRLAERWDAMSEAQRPKQPPTA